MSLAEKRGLHAMTSVVCKQCAITLIHHTYHSESATSL
jgi:hypothetical protein